MKLAVTLVFATIALAACGSAHEQTPDLQDPADATELKTGTQNFLDAPSNMLTFITILDTKHYEKKIHYKAPEDGRLSLARNGVGIGETCTESTGKGDFDVDYKFIDLATGQERQADTPELIPSLHVTKDEELEIYIELTSHTNCNRFTLEVLANFAQGHL